MDIKFKSIEELKQRLMPALRIRRRELSKKNKRMSEEVIWEYLIENVWKNETHLTLADMVDDILNQEIII